MDGGVPGGGGGIKAVSLGLDAVVDLMLGSPRRSVSVTVSPRKVRVSRAGLRAVMWRSAQYWAAARKTWSSKRDAL